MSEKLIVIKTLEELKDLEFYLEDKNFIALDTETTGTKRDSHIVGLSVSAETDLAFYVVLKYWDPVSQTIIDLETLTGIKSLIESIKSKNLIMHNSVFDCMMIELNYGISLINSVHTDTMILAHIVDENRRVGLKELGVSMFGENAAKEQKEMKESVTQNGGKLTKDCYELYKADADLLAHYGAKDALLTLKIFYIVLEQLYEQDLDKFFYEESMPLLKTATYDMNNTGLKIDLGRLQQVKGTLEAEILEASAFIAKETESYTKDKFKKFNPNSGDQLAWLLYFKMGNLFDKLTESGKEICKSLNLKVPYNNVNKRQFVAACTENNGLVYKEAEFNHKTKKMARPKKVGEPWKYLSTDAASLKILAPKYKWVEKLLELNKNKKLLNTYVVGIQEKIHYGIIYPSFLQHGTTSGRYSSRSPNFQNLPRKDKRIKSFVISRPGKVFIGADYSQLEPRVFASMSKDETLMASFAKGDDFYSVVGAKVFGKTGYSLVKDDPNSFAIKFPDLREKAKVLALATPYGRTASFTASQMNVKREEAQEMMDDYFKAYPKVELMMLMAHSEAKSNGVVFSLYGRPRRIPDAKDLDAIYKGAEHSELPYEARTLLNLAFNHKIQSTGASVVNRSAIRFKELCMERGFDVKIVLQVHDEIVVECDDKVADQVSLLLKEAMETTVILPGVKLEAVPKIARNLADLK